MSNTRPTADSITAEDVDDQLDQLEDLMRDTAIPKTLYRQINVNLWEQDVTPDDDKEAITTYVARFLSEGEFNIHLQGYEILSYFQEHFNGWTEETWENADKTYRRILRQLLKRRGIYTGRSNGSITKQFVSLQTIEDPLDWPVKDFEEMTFDEGTSAHRRQKASVRRSPTPHRTTAAATTPAASPQPPVATSIAATALEPKDTEDPLPTQTSFPTLLPTVDLDPQARLTAHPTTYRFNHPEIVQAVTVPAQPTELRSSANPVTTPLEAYTRIPPEEVANGIVDAELPQKFAKLWVKDKNYTGEPYDLLDDKVRIFMSVCYTLQATPDKFHALFPRILTGRAQTYYIEQIKWTSTFRKAYDSIKQHFDTEVNHVHYYTNWTTITFNKLRAENANKSLHDVLQLLFDKLQLCQRALGKDYAGDIPLRTTLINACRGVPELEYALFKPAEKIETLFADLRSSVETHLTRRTASQFTQDTDGSFDHVDPQHQYYLDRRYNNNRGQGRYSYSGQRPNRGYRHSYDRGSYRPQDRSNYGFSHTNRNWNKKCFVCGKEACWSTKHTAEERQKAKDQYVTHCHFTGVQLMDFATYILDYEGHEMDDLDDNDIWEENDNGTDNHPKQWQASQMLCQQAFNHLITGEDVYQTDQTTVPASQFVIDDRYSKDKFQGIMIDTGAAKVSTAGHSQYIALQREDPSVALDSSTSGQATIKFGNGEATHSVGSIALKTPVGRITFHIL
ncbi:hypothetical protein HIM_12126 [Hirsutella minnesotensis 3608]|uniref:Uncharacterized protein n=1 Tax=Hirsutella minnesotensis 3608 TaxID=1043627 RepID=A0A0F7ZID5_9HYPO|nr:hypothetical protein HIM_12126 [Hirsutella minnesotensis 3608]